MIRLLYVDDEPDLLQICRLFLEREGEFNVTISESAVDGLEKMRTGSIDVIVSDYQMPGMDGIAFLKAVRTLSADMPFILFTGRGREEVVIDAINNGVDFYLQKGGDPIAQFSELGHKVRQAFRRKRAEEDLRTAYEKNKGLMDHASDAILIADIASGMLIDANPKALELTNRTLTEIRTMRQAELHPGHEGMDIPVYFAQYAKNGTGSTESTIIDRSGKVVPVIVSTTVIVIGGRRCLMSIFHDISEIKKAQYALQLANKKLNLLAEITRHDIRNRLTVLGGYIDLFRERPPEPQHSMYLQKIKETMNTIGSTIEFTRLYQNLGVSAPCWQDVGNVFTRACTLTEMKKTRMLTQVNGLQIYADPLLERVFYNLVENALKHGNRVHEIKLSAKENADALVLTFEDDGIGIPDYDKEKIFQRGFGKNTGLGLFLVREILSTTNITIRETGQYMNGARFEITVPRGEYILRTPEISLAPTPGIAR